MIDTVDIQTHAENQFKADLITIEMYRSANDPEINEALDMFIERALEYQETLILLGEL